MLRARRWEIVAFSVTCCSLAALAAFQRWPGLNPSSLYLDDQWAASLIKAGSPGIWWEIMPQIPLGFLLIIKALFHAGGRTDLSLQILSFVCGLLQVPAMGLVAWMLTGRMSLGLLAAALCVLCPGFGEFATRVKPYTLESLLTTAIIGLSIPWARRGDVKALRTLICAALASLMFSFTVLVVSVCLVGTIYAFHAWNERRVVRCWAEAGWIAALVVGSILTYLFMARKQTNWSLIEFWEPYYLPWQSARATLNFLGAKGLDAIRLAFPETLSAYVPWLVAAGLVGALAVKETRLIGLAFMSFYAALLIMAALKMYPMGGGRTDIFGYPVSLLAATSVFVPVLRAKRIGRAVGALAALATLLLVWEGKDRRFPYINANDSKAAIQFLAGHIRDEDGLIVYPHANWAIAYYGKWPYRVIPDDRVANNFSTMILRDRTLTLPSGVGRIQYWNHPDVLAPFLEDFASHEIPAIYYLSTSNPIDLGVAQLFHNHAYRIDPNNSFGMFTVTKFVKVH